MKWQNKIYAKDFFLLLVAVMSTVLVCNWLTPTLYDNFGGIHRTGLILDKLKDPTFSPDMIIFGSSKSMMGLDGYQMTKDLGIDVYNFSSPSQSPLESSLYYAILPPSVKSVVQIIEAPIKLVGKVRKKKSKLRKSVVVPFAITAAITMLAVPVTEASSRSM